MKRHDVELVCDGCQRETLATDGCWIPTCWVCGGRRRIAKAHDHVLTWEESKALGYSIRPVGGTTSSADPVQQVSSRCPGDPGDAS